MSDSDPDPNTTIVEKCDISHYRILFKVSEFLENIVRNAPFPYVVRGGYAIKKTLEQAGYVPNIADDWDTFDWDIDTVDAGAFTDYIIDRLSRATKLDPSNFTKLPLVNNIGRGFGNGNRQPGGYQLAMNICHLIQIPKDLKRDSDRDRSLQLMDVFSVNAESLQSPQSPQSIQSIQRIQSINFATPQVLLNNLEQTLKDRLEILHNPYVSGVKDYWIELKKIESNIHKYKNKYTRAMTRYIELLKNVGSRARSIDKARNSVDKAFDLLMEYLQINGRARSYETVNIFIEEQHKIYSIASKVNKIRRRLELLRELVIFSDLSNQMQGLTL